MRFCSLVTLATIKDLGPEEIFQETDGNLKKGNQFLASDNQQVINFLEL